MGVLWSQTLSETLLWDCNQAVFYLEALRCLAEKIANFNGSLRFC